MRTREYISGLIEQEIAAGIPSERIVLGGFSQGGAASIFSGLTAKFKLAGIVSLSAYLMLSLKFATMVPNPQFNKETPIFMGHGDMDGVVFYEIGRKSHDLLKGLGYNVNFKTYEGMEHSACPEELDDVEAFLNERLPKLRKTDKDNKSTEDKLEL